MRSPLRFLAAPALWARMLNGALKMGLLAVGVLLAVVVPSSGRAGEFIKLGSPIGDPVNLYGIKSIYNGDQRTYEAWAVGETATDGGVGTGRGVILHYTGSYWTRIAFDTDIPVLRAVDGARFIRYVNEDGTGTWGQWSTIAFAVGDDGAIYRLSPYTGAWRPEMRLIGSNPERSCLDAELLQNNGDDCTEWTTSDLKTVSANTNYNVHVGGDAVGGVGTMLYYGEQFIQNSTGTALMRRSYWGQDSITATLGGANVTDIHFIDDHHGWISGYLGNDGRIWKWTNQGGYASVRSEPGVKFTSVAAVLRSDASKPNEPLRSVVWLGAENGNVYRYDEAATVNAFTTQYTGAPNKSIRSLAVARRQAGANMDLIKNGDFFADQRTSGYLNRVPDGWRVNGEYYNVRDRGILMTPSALIPNGSGGNIYVGTTWQPGSHSRDLSATGRYVFQTGNGFQGVYPYASYFEVQQGLPTYTLQLREQDASTGLLKQWALYHETRGGLFPFGYIFTSGPNLLGASIKGLLKITPSQPYQFRVVSPNGKAELYIEQDLANDKATLCYGGTDDGKVCNYANGDADCAPPGVCRGTKYPNQVNTGAWPVNPPLTAAFSPGECRNVPQRYCVGGSNNGGICTASITQKICTGSEAGKVCTTKTDCAQPAICVNDLTQILAQCPKGPSTCKVGRCSTDPEIICTLETGECDETGGTCLTDECTSDDQCGDVPGFDNGCVSPKTPTCSSSVKANCFDDSECLMGFCENPSEKASTRCEIDDDCGPATYRQSISGKCQPLGVCSGGSRDGLGCIQYSTYQSGVTPDANADCPDGTCQVGKTGLCQQSTTSTKLVTPNGNSEVNYATTPTVSFTGTGVISKECTGGTAAGMSCYDTRQCNGSPCGVVPSGWYPFVIQYYQVNAAECINGSSAGRSCVNNRSCGTCVNKSWCVGGSASGKPCDSDVGSGVAVPGPRTAECTSGSGSCQLQYKVAVNDLVNNPYNFPGMCVLNNVTSTRPCWSTSDCIVDGQNYGVCSLSSKYTDGTGSELGLQWRTYDGSVWSAWSDVPSDNIMSAEKPNNSTSITQEVPFSNIPGATYRVTGSYKVDFPNYFPVCTAGYTGSCYQPDDPRLRAAPHAGVRVSCKNGGNCGYDVNTLLTDPSYGVVGTVDGVSGKGYCSNSTGTTCTTNSECGTDGYCSVMAKGDDAGWQQFSLTLSKQQQDRYGVRVADDGSQTLVVECYADVGAQVFCKDIEVTMVNSAAVADIDAVDLLAVGDGGTMVRGSIDLITSSESWTDQRMTTVDANLYSVTAPDPFHYWVVGNKKPGEAEDLITLLAMNPGNVSGWGWMGTSTEEGKDPLGWIDFNCGNLGTCQSQPSSYGVNVSDPDTKGVCRDNVSLSCTTGAMPDGCGRCISAITGSAWLGNRDPAEKADFGPCQDLITRPNASRYCSGDLTLPCTSDSVCTAKNPEWHCLAATPALCEQDSTRTFTFCIGNTARLCNNTSQCYGTCAKNQGFKCADDKQCVVSCSENPAACKSAGWLSFDRSVTGNPPAAPYQSLASPAPLAVFDAETNQVTGWGRLQLGVCTNDESKSCFKAADCGTGNTCSYKNAASWETCTSTYDETICNNTVGWVKFSATGSSTKSADSLMQCKDCTQAGAPSGTGIPGSTCKICTWYDEDARRPATSGSSCNECDGCALKRCTLAPDTFCTNNEDCTSGQGTCSEFGFNFSDGGYCFNMATDPDCIPGAQCRQCAMCSDYGVSIDYADTKDFSGFAYSHDVGWIDFSNVRIGGKQFLQTRYGDIYSGGDIGSPSTSKAPGYPGGIGLSTNLCNATYRLVAVGTITNFCTSASTAGAASDPFRQENATVYPMPTAENRYTTQIGSIDIDGIAAVAKTVGSTTYNKYGDVVVKRNDNNNLSAFFNASECGKPCEVQLDGRVLHVTGNLTIDRDFRLMPGTKNGSGTIVVDGNLIVSANVEYGTSGSLASVRMLPSVGFLVKGDITVQASVSYLSGTFFTSKNIVVASNPPDLQLVVSGSMVASKFEFQREYYGSAGVSEPAELVIFDGRLQTNTPPGFSSLATGVMSIQSVGQ